jgi:hypothetical protein
MNSHDLNAGLLFMSDDTILLAYMPSSLLDLDKNKYDIVNIYPGPQEHKAKWWDQDNDLFDRGTQGATDGYRYNIGKKSRPLGYDMMNYQVAGYFKINAVTHLEDSTYQSRYPEADIDPKAKNRWAMKFGVHSGSGDEQAATYEICGSYLGNDIGAKIVGAEAPWKRMWRPKGEDIPKPKIKLPPLTGKWFGVMVFRWNDKDDKSVNMECWVDLDGLNEIDKPQNKWQKYVEFNDNGKKLQSKGDYFDPISKNRGNDEDCHATLRINSVEYEAKYLFVREIECPHQAVDNILQESNC